jgi:nitric oxide dioxygenase
MNASDVALVQDSFKKVAPISDVAAELFYGRLFEVAPQVKPMFRGDMKEQGRKLMATLGVVVTGLTRLETVLPAASALAKQHVAYGVKAEHFRSSAVRCCGPWRRASATHGRPNSPQPGPQPMARCPAT